ncbi:MAG: DUF4003 family protein [Gemmatimonadota bacterium]|nr:MAG: DUF4003 family protein [Gemmatimonadota bacterium]
MNNRITIPEDPMSRFRDLYAALEKDRRWWRDTRRLRYAAMAAVGCEGTPVNVAQGIRRMEKALKEASPWHLNIGAHMRFIVAALLYQNRDSGRGFMNELRRVRKLFRGERLPRTLVFELIAVLILRIQAGGATVSQSTVRRLRDIYQEMKRHHRFLTGADDLPACAILTGQEGTATKLVDRTEAIYGELRAQGFQKGNPLQTTANVLSLAPGLPHELAGRATSLKQRFKSKGVRINQRDYDELAILSFLSQPTSRVVDRVLAQRAQLKQIRPKIDRATTFDLAAGITFLELAGRQVHARMLSGTKAMIDMQAIVAAQQAVLVCAAGAAVAASASSG